MGPILLASSSGGLLEAAFDDMSLFPSKSWDAKDKVILGYISRLFGLSPLVLDNYSPRHGPWALVERGPDHKFPGPTVRIIDLTIEVAGLFLNLVGNFSFTFALHPHLLF